MAAFEVSTEARSVSCYRFGGFCYHFGPVEDVDRPRRPPPEPPSVGSDRQLDRGVPKLLLHVGQGDAGGQEERGVRHPPTKGLRVEMLEVAILQR